MEKILIVEDNKSLAKMIALKIEKSLDFEVHQAYNKHEAELFVRRYDYFVTLLDLNLPDAPDGEVVDFMIERKQNIIVLSGNLDKEVRKEIVNKDIIDYVSKGGVEDIDYVIATLRRLQKNRKHTIMVVDDSRVFRNQMKSMLEKLFFKVIACVHGEEALGFLRDRDDIKLIITDYNMPVIDGLELTVEVRKKFKKEQLGILALSGTQDEDISALFLKKGATDYIKKPFSKEEFSCRINNTIEALENIEMITNSANRDFLTGLYNRRYFFREMKQYIATPQSIDKRYSVAMIDIDDFKKVNDTYGHDIGDKVIVKLSEVLNSMTHSKDLVARFGGEEFAIVLRDINQEQTKNVLEKIRQNVESLQVYINAEEYIKFTISTGYTTHCEESLEEMLNQADMMLYNAKREGKNRVVGE